jgi:Leucine-rich repeat (LRR) protein
MSDLAMRLIAENKRTRDTFLDLGNCGLRKVPGEVGELVWLEDLSFASRWFEWDGRKWQQKESRNTGEQNQLTDLAPLAGLSALQSLYLSRTQVTDLAPLAGLSALQSLFVWHTQVTDLGPLADLSALQTLNFSDTMVTDLAPLAGLSSLQTLDVAGTQVSDLAPVASLSALQSLDVSRTQVSDLTPLAGLSALQTLDVSNTLVSDLGTLVGLSALETLNVSGTQVTDLAPLVGLSALRTLDIQSTKVSDLAPLARLTALQTLSVGYSEVHDLAPLAGLSAGHTLDLSSTQVTDLSPLAGMPTLRTLSVHATNVPDLAPLAGLSALQELAASHTQVHDLTPLAGLSALHMLYVYNTQVSDVSPVVHLIRQGLPVKWSSDFGGGDGIYVEGCPLANPPPEIVKQGNDAILNYFRERETGGVDHLYEAKMLILGEGGAGKTSLLRRLYQPGQPLPTESETTKGIVISRQEFKLKDGRPFRLNVWDFGGQQIYHATHQFFLTHRSLYVLVDDTRKDYKSVSDEGFKYWLELIDVFGGHSPTLIFQNEKDGRSKAIDFEGIKRRYGNVEKCYAGNLEKADAADDIRDGIEFFASHLSHIGEELPARWLKVRADVEELAAKKPYVPVEKYFEIYSRHMESDRSRALFLSRYLHDLGVFLHFQDDPLLARTVILQNEWATTAVFRILDDETVKAQRGRFSSDDCDRLWPDSVYADMHPELLALMQKFELCYELRDSKPPIWLAPQLLPPAKPAALADWGSPKDLVLRYRYEFLPKGVISRLTVRLHRFVINPEMAWVTGVLFERDRTAVLVEVLANGSEIELRARGPEHKALLSVIAADLDALNESFQGLRNKVDKRIPCNCGKCRVASAPEFFDQKELLYRKEHNKLKVECRRSFEDVDVLELLDGINLDKLPPWKDESPGASSQARVAASPREIRIFLASSAELREDRDAFELYFLQQNHELLKKGFQLKVERWENFFGAMSKTRSQDEYNKVICQCDVFVSLFGTKTGKYTEEEFDVAHRQFQSSGKPLIYTFFKDTQITTGSAPRKDLESLWAFQDKLKELEHFYDQYDNIEDLKLQFRGQLDKILEQYG